MTIKTLETEQFILNYPLHLENFVFNSINFFNERSHYLYSLFNERLNKIKVIIFDNKTDFHQYISFISKGKIPPLSWASGCCYNNEIQIIVDPTNLNELNNKITILAHETTHLYFNNLIYKKYKIKRIRWFDESYANYIDGKIKLKTKETIILKANSLLEISDTFDMNSLNELNALNDTHYNVYDMFLLIGKYIFESKLHKIYLHKLINEPKSIIEIGKYILNDAIKHVLNS